MEQDNSPSFYDKINSLYDEIAAGMEKTGQATKERKALAEYILVKNKKWAKYPVEVLETLDSCLEKYDKSRPFSNYLTSSLSLKIRSTEIDEEQKNEEEDKREIPFLRKNDEGDVYAVTDIEPPALKHLTDIQKIDIIDDFKNVLDLIQAALNEEKENRIEKARFVTRDILYIISNKGYELLEELKDSCLPKHYSFLDTTLWNNFFNNTGDYEKGLPTQELLAASMGIKKSNASKMLSRFYERLKKRSQISIITEA